MKRVLLNIKEEELAAADREAERLGTSRAELIRRALDDFLAKRRGEQEELEARARARELNAAMDRSAAILSQDKSWDPIAITRAWREHGRKL